MAHSTTDAVIGAWPNAKARLMMWSTGVRSGSSLEPRQVVVVEDAGVVDRLRETDLVDADAFVFAPGDAAGALAYEGSIAGPGTEFVISEDFFLQVQTYAISEYVSVVGPTLIRLADSEDLEILSSDVQNALDTGAFPEFLTNPIVQLADLPALGMMDGGAGPDARLWVASDGSIGVSSAGVALGALGADRAGIEAAWTARLTQSGDAGALGAHIPRTDVEAFHARTPALRRFLGAVEGIRNLRARRLPLPRVSGFGTTLLPEVDPAAGSSVPAHLPFLMSSAERHFLVQAGAHRVFEISESAAAAFEAVLHLGDQAGEVVGADAAGSAIQALQAQGIALDEHRVAA